MGRGPGAKPVVRGPGCANPAEVDFFTFTCNLGGIFSLNFANWLLEEASNMMKIWVKKNYTLKLTMLIYIIARQLSFSPISTTIMY